MKDLEKSRDKNKEKIKEIEILTNKYEQLQSQFNSINKKETTLKSKLVILETDNEHYLNKIHQYEEEVTDLKDNLENYIENLITTQTEFEEYKSKKEEEIERLRQTLQEEKDNINALMKKNKKENDNNINIKNEKQIENSGKISKEKKQNQAKIEITEDDEKERETLLELGRTRSNRAMTMQKSSYNYEDIISGLRQKKERLANLNKKIKRDSGKLK